MFTEEFRKYLIIGITVILLAVIIICSKMGSKGPLKNTSFKLGIIISESLDTVNDWTKRQLNFTANIFDMKKEVEKYKSEIEELKAENSLYKIYKNERNKEQVKKKLVVTARIKRLIMRRFYILSFMAVSMFFATQMFAQSTMTDQQVLDYAKEGVASGKSQKVIAQELVAKGVSRAQAARVKKLYESQLGGAEKVVAVESAAAASREHTPNGESAEEIDPMLSQEVLWQLPVLLLLFFVLRKSFRQ